MTARVRGSYCTCADHLRMRGSFDAGVLDRLTHICSDHLFQTYTFVMLNKYVVLKNKLFPIKKNHLPQSALPQINVPLIINWCYTPAVRLITEHKLTNEFCPKVYALNLGGMIEGDRIWLASVLKLLNISQTGSRRMYLKKD